MEITLGQIVGVSVGVGISGMVAYMFNRVKKIEDESLTKDQHVDKCGAVQANLLLDVRKYFDEKVDKLEKNLKDHVDKAVNGGNHG